MESQPPSENLNINPTGEPAKTPAPTTQPEPRWRPNRESAYLAMRMILDGKFPQQIANEIFEEHRGNRELERVRSLLEFARDRGIVKLQPPLNEDLINQLNQRFTSQQIKFQVVNNDYAAYSENPWVDEAMHADAVCHQAAEEIARRIEKLLRERRGDPRPIVIANAGGRAVSRIVRFLAGQKIIPEEGNPQQLLFISLNSASIPTAYGLSANVLAVRMSEIYGGRHIAWCPIWGKEVKDRYDDAVNHIDLLICGAGARDGILFHWLENHVKLALPTGAVGDCCLIPLALDGHEVPLKSRAVKDSKAILHCHPSYANLLNLAEHDRVVSVPIGSQADDGRDRHNAPQPRCHSKRDITRAILAGCLTRTCILGVTLAREILEVTAKRKSSF